MKKEFLYFIFISLHKIVFIVPLPTKDFHGVFLLIIKTVGINDKLGMLAVL